MNGAAASTLRQDQAHRNEKGKRKMENGKKKGSQGGDRQETRSNDGCSLCAFLLVSALLCSPTGRL